MKNYEEMAEVLFERREKYNSARAKRLKKLKAAAAAASCFCIVAILGIGLFGNQTPAEPKIEEPSDVININLGNALSAPKTDAADISDVKKVDADIRDLIKNIAPKLPGDMKANCGYVVCTADRAADNSPSYLTTFSSSGDAGRNVNIEVCNGDTFNTDGEKEKFEKSTIKGKTVYIALTDSGKYYAVFESVDVGFRINAEGITQDELIVLIESLL